LLCAGRRVACCLATETGSAGGAGSGGKGAGIIGFACTLLASRRSSPGLSEGALNSTDPSEVRVHPVVTNSPQQSMTVVAA